MGLQFSAATVNPKDRKERPNQGGEHTHLTIDFYGRKTQLHGTEFSWGFKLNSAGRKYSFGDGTVFPWGQYPNSLAGLRWCVGFGFAQESRVGHTPGVRWRGAP